MKVALTLIASIVCRIVIEMAKSCQRLVQVTLKMQESSQLAHSPAYQNGEMASFSRSRAEKISDGCFGHPVVIPSTDQRKKEAAVLVAIFH